MDLDELALIAKQASERADAGSTDDETALSDAIERALRYLGHRPRTERQVRDKLRKLDFDPSTVDAAIARLVELRLIDDAGFARMWIEERARTKGKAPDLLVSELRARGIERATAEAALEEAGIDEAALATEIAFRLVRRVARHPLEQQGRRLYELLRRRGFEEEHAEAGARAVLPPEGWD